MKPASVVVLILAALLVIGGTVLCFVGNSTAKKDGTDLFTQVRDGKPYMKQEFAAGKISKIELVITDATVNITGGDINSYIEFINYNPNMYNLDVTSQAISFEEIGDVKSLFNIWENGFGFKGYRNILNFKALKSGTGEKTVNIHLGDGSLISTVILKGENLKINVQNAEIKKDFKIDVVSAEIGINDFAAGASISVSADDVKLRFEAVSCGSLNVNSQTAAITSTASDIRNVTVNTGKGSVQIENASRGKQAEFDFTTKSGTITIDGEAIDSTLYSVKAEAEEIKYSYRIKTDSASISYTNLTEEQPEESGTEETATEP